MRRLTLPLISTALLLAACGGGGTTPPAADTTAPSVSLSAAQNGTTVNLTANTSDNVGVTKVEFYRGTEATPFETDTTAPYTAGFTVSSANNGTLNVTAKAYDAAGNQGQGGAQVLINVARTPTLYQGVWGWAVANTSGTVIANGVFILSEQVAEAGRTVAFGVYTNDSQTQTGFTLLGPIAAAGTLETGFTYDLSTTDSRIYLIARDTDGQLENFQGSATFFGEGTVFNRTTQEPSQAVRVVLVQVSAEVPTSQSAKIQAESAARNLAADAVKRQFANNRATTPNLAPASQSFSPLKSAALHLLNNR
ncbi:Ig-like domain-containing protein [Deinococcus puniceus]|uniref:Ig-like domain-containing protein n=1 Tax=Deinococcus puniceus TaxID=1182568 RepID=UPI0012FC47D4|nr:Ig-like domain-containing protein [Deinococcus puniceus]